MITTYKEVKIINIIIIILSFTSAGISKTETTYSDNYLEKFHARHISEKLSKENIKDIEFIETIAKNFGYIDNQKLRKEYWQANLLVTSRQISKARFLFEKNRININSSLKIISLRYKKDTLKILEECISLLSDKKIEAGEDNNNDKKEKFIKNQLRLKVAYEELKNAKKSFSLKQYRNSINLYRIVKKHAISVLKDLSTEKELNKIMNKYKVHIVDNRHEVYKRG